MYTAADRAFLIPIFAGATILSVVFLIMVFYTAADQTPKSDLENGDNIAVGLQ
jgi:hypothetical protein